MSVETFLEIKTKYFLDEAGYKSHNGNEFTVVSKPGVAENMKVTETGDFYGQMADLQWCSTSYIQTKKLNSKAYVLRKIGAFFSNSIIGVYPELSDAETRMNDIWVNYKGDYNDQISNYVVSEYDIVDCKFVNQKLIHMRKPKYVERIDELSRNSTTVEKPSHVLSTPTTNQFTLVTGSQNITIASPLTSCTITLVNSNGSSSAK